MFEILDRTPEYLDEETHLYEAAEQFLRSWFSLDSRTFPTLHRLAECYLRWLQHELKETPLDEQLARQLLAKARAAYRESIAAAHRVLLSGAGPPAWFANYSYREVEYKAYHGWAVLEGTAAVQLADAGEARGLFASSAESVGR